MIPKGAMTLYDNSENTWSLITTSHPAWDELLHYLGGQFRKEWLHITDADIHAEFAKYPDAATFYRETDVYLYNGLGYFFEGWKRSWYAHLLSAFGGMGRGISILDYGCGIGCDGLWLLDANFKVSFADVESRSLDFLRWRLWARRFAAEVYVLPSDSAEAHPEIPLHAVVWCMDVLEHLPSPMHERFLVETLPARGQVVFVNLVHDVTADGTVHHPVDIETLTAAVKAAFGFAYAEDRYLNEAGSYTRLLVYGNAVLGKT